MKRICLFLLIIITLPLGAQLLEDVIGFTGINITFSTFGVAATGAAWLDNMWYEKTGRTVDHVRVFVTAVTGSPLAADQTIEIQGDTTSAPNGTPITNGTLTTATTPAANTIVDFSPSGTHPVLSAGTQYHMVIKNATAATTVTYRYLQAPIPFFQASPANLGGYGCQTTSNSGTAWAACTNQGVPYFRIDFSNGDHRGIPIEAATIGTASLTANEKLFNSKLIALSFTTYNITSLQPIISGVSCFIKKVGSPTGNLSGTLYSDNGTDIAAVTGGAAGPTYIPSQVVSAGGQLAFRFSSSITLSPNTKYLFAFANSASDTSSNYYYITHNQIADETVDKSMMPMAGTWRIKYCTSSCTSTGNSANWTLDVNGSIATIPLCYLTLDSTTPYAPGTTTNASYNFGFAK